MHTILGSGGAIGFELSSTLGEMGHKVRLVSRTPHAVSAHEETHSADLTNPALIRNALTGSSVCYLTAGFEYNTNVWQKIWPPLMKSVISACSDLQIPLIFFDNIYALDPASMGHITEASPMKPVSEKGKVRAEVDQMLIEAIEKGKLQGVIARAPDFFGPIGDKSLIMNLMYNNLQKGKQAQWFCGRKFKHSSGYTPDLAKGTALIGTDPGSWNRIWNLPVSNEAPTADEWVDIFASAMDVKPRLQILPNWGVRALGLFVPILREMVEMLYQYDRDYIFDSSDFCKRFSYVPLTTGEAVRLTVAKLKE
jgi:nucleoside-diphosphate-sugar epimerase